MRSFSYTPPAGFSEEFLLHALGHAVLVRSFSYIPRASFSVRETPRAGFSERFLLHP